MTRTGRRPDRTRLVRPHRFHLWILLALAGSVADGQGFGTRTPLLAWKFHLGDDVDPTTGDLDAGEWREVVVPHDWSVELPASPDQASCMGYLPGGIGWYRTDLEIPSEPSDRRFGLSFEGVYNRSTVFVNGQPVGHRPNGYVSFFLDITGQVKRGERNRVCVRVDHSRAADSRWYTGSGIYRPAWLVSAHPVHLGLWGVRYVTEPAPQGAVKIGVDTTVDNESGSGAKAEIHHTLRSSDGSTVAATTNEMTIPAGGSAAVHGDLHVATPMRWSVQTPSLYHLETSLIVDGQARDRTTTRVGIRTLAFDPDTGFALNGEPLKVKGVCLHHDAGVLGAAVPPEVWRERLLTLRQLGCNAIRLSHNPQAPALYDLCDELGFLVMDEAFDEWEHPKKKWITGWNKGDPGFQGSADFFAEWGERDLADMVRRDRNHPCVFLWSIGNEVDYPNDPYSHPILDREGIGQQHVAGYQPSQPPAERLGEIATRLAAVVRREDRSRPVTAALAGAVMSNETEYPAALDVVGYNYTEGRYAEDHETYPDRVLYGSETRHDLAAWKAVADNDFIFGQFIWTGFDYLGESGPWPSRGFTTGMVDLANTIKPLGQFRRSLWSDEPMASLATQRSRGRRADRGPRDLGRSWNYQPDQPVRVVCFTNADEAELFLDGKPYGSKRPRDPETAIIGWDVSYRPGELQVVAFRGGDRVASDSILTAGDPAAIVAESRSRTLRGRFAVAVLPVSIVDAGGHPIWSATNQITCSISGPGRLLGLENATPDASEDLRGPSIACRHGRLIAYVQAVADAGEIEVAFTAQGLEPARVQLPIEAGARIGNAPAP